MVHHDAHCKNVLFRGDQLIALIDFDDAHEGYLVADVAVMIANWAKDGTALDLRKAATVVRAYEQHRPLTSAERQFLPDFVLLFLLCDASEYIRGRLARGADSTVAVNDCIQYERYLYYTRDSSRLAEMRRELTATPS